MGVAEGILHGDDRLALTELAEGRGRGVGPGSGDLKDDVGLGEIRNRLGAVARERGDDTFEDDAVLDVTLRGPIASLTCR